MKALKVRQVLVSPVAEDDAILRQARRVQAAAQSLAASPPPDPDADIRVDLTHHAIVTIDDASTTEVDDGLSVEALPDGRRRLWVHVADPSRWVQPGSVLDLEARRRASTLYLPTGARTDAAAGPHMNHSYYLQL